MYEEVLQWRRNCYSVLNGEVLRDVVNELSRLYLAYGAASALKSITLKAAIVFSILLLQKPRKWSSERSMHTIFLERRLKSRFSGDLEELLKEGRALQQCLPKY